MAILENWKLTVKASGVLAVLLLACAFPASALADGAGKAIFVIGDVTLVPASGPPVRLKKGQILHVGDRIDTSDNGQVQIKMVDGAFVAVRPGSSFVVSKYRMAENPENHESEFELLKGGFRAITGKIGKSNKKAYKVKTPAATLGIRGTDYVAMYCENDCAWRDKRSGGEEIANGLYVAVVSGGVHLDNEVGSIDVDKGEYAYIEGLYGRLEHIENMPVFLMFETVTPGDDDIARYQHRKETVDEHAEDEHLSDVGQRQSEDVLDNYWEFSQSATRNTLTNLADKGKLVSVYGTTVSSVSDVITVGGNTVRTMDLGTGTGPVAVVDLGSANQYNLGYDAATGLTWGRWANGSVVVYDPATATSSDLALGSESIHWISGGNPQDSIVLPITGLASYVLIGNTDPTDNLGNTGILGYAALSADFTNSTMDASLEVSINNQVWSGTSAGMAIDANPVSATYASFGGAMSSVTVSDPAAPGVTGTGQIAGVFTSSGSTAGTAPGGAAISYTMSADINATPTTVTGVAAFELLAN